MRRDVSDWFLCELTIHLPALWHASRTIASLNMRDDPEQPINQAILLCANWWLEHPLVGKVAFAEEG